MRFPFENLPQLTARRPVARLEFADLPGTRFAGHVDSGSLRIRLNREWADLLGIDLEDAPRDNFVVAGTSYEGRVARVRLKVAGHKHTWECDVTFAENYTHTALLGLRGFFDNFAVKIDGLDQQTTLTPKRRSTP